MKYFTKFLCLFLGAAMMLTMAACGSKSDTDANAGADGEKKQLVVATSPDFPPFEFLDGSQIVGIEPALMQAIADKLGMELVWEQVDFDSIIPGIQAERYDVGAAGITITPDRQKNCDFSNPYFLANQVIVVNPGSDIQGKADLAGKTIYAPGQGANPEYILRYVLTGNGLDPDKDVTIQFVGEGSELLTVWQSDPDALILAPQPVATSILMQNENAAKLFDMTEEWSKISGNQLMMGCVIVRNAFLQENPGAVELFLKEYAASIEKAQTDVEGTAALCEQYGLIPKAALAQKAIPSCGLTFVTGAEMKTDLSAYLQVMYDADPKSVGGALPGDDFYYYGA